jgi:glycosyltransferase involved in cell wall biosynthesis
VKILIQLSDESYNNYNFVDVKNGNSGIGGTTYQQLLLANEMIDMGHDVTFLHFSQVTYDKRIKGIKFQTDKIIEIKFDFAVLTHSDVLESIITSLINTENIFFWAHIQLNLKELKFLETNRVKRVVFAGYETAMWFYDTNIRDKISFIYASLSDQLLKFEYIQLSSDFKIDRNKCNICFMGSITKAKGFHIVTKNWKSILKKIPNAHLHVIGSGLLYNKSSPLGPMKLASEEYEKLILKPFKNHPELLENITFYGVLGIEKYDLLKQMDLAIVNPLATSEVCSITALEFSLFGVPIVSKKRYGMVDTLIDGLNGYSFRININFVRTLFKAKKSSYEIIRNHSIVLSWLRENFSSSVNANKWIKLSKNFNDVNDLEFRNYFDNYKIYRILNKKLREYLEFLPPSIYFYYLFIFFKKKVRYAIKYLDWRF